MDTTQVIDRYKTEEVGVVTVTGLERPFIHDFSGEHGPNDSPIPEIPLERRLIVIDTDDFSEIPLDADALAEQLGISAAVVSQLAEEIGIYSSETETGLQFPVFTLPVLRDELQWRALYDALPETISQSTIAKIFERNPSVFHDLLQKGGYLHRSNTPRHGITDFGYDIPKHALNLIRYHEMMIPMAHDSPSISELCDVTGKSDEWVRRKLKVAGYELQVMRSKKTKKAGDHTDPDATGYLVDLAQSLPPKAGEEFVNTRAMRDQLGRSDVWIRKRLKEFKEFEIEKLDSIGRVRTHYPLFVFHRLKARSDYERSLPPMGDMLSLKQVARHSGHSMEVSSRILSYLDEQPTPCLDNAGRPNEGYDTALIETLKAFDTRLLEPDPKERLCEIRRQLSELYCDAEDTHELLRALRGDESEWAEQERAILQEKLNDITRERKRLYGQHAIAKAKYQQALEQLEQTA